MAFESLCITIRLEYKKCLVCSESSIIPTGKTDCAAHGVLCGSSELTFVELSY
jgi:hypothetical protein